MRLRIIALNGNASEHVVTAPLVRLGRDPACEVAFDANDYPMVSGEHARIARTDKGYFLTHLSRSNKTLLNDQPVEATVSLKAGDRVRLGLTGPTIEIVALTTPRPVLAPAPPPEPEFSSTVGAAPEHLALLRGSLGTERMPIGKGGMIGREQGIVAFFLDHAHVSRRHARLNVDANGVLLRDLASANGTFLNGRRITEPVWLNSGDRIDIGPFSLQFDGEALVSRSRSNNIELVAHRLSRVVKDRATGKPLTLLDDLSVVIRPREFVCLLGPSGSGKSTLLGMLSGRSAPSKGRIRVNGQDLYENFAALKQDTAVVPQREMLHETLAVGSALRYTAELRLPPDTARGELADSVSDILDVVGLSRPSLLFLDEVTSGLDEQTDREMMELFRQLAEGGKTVVCITHSLANVESTCHLVVILAEGGQLAFVGTTAEARQYFRIDRLGDVYRKLAERAPEDWKADFLASPLHARYVRDRLPARGAGDEAETASAGGAAPTRVNPLRQAWILTRRYVAIWCGDPLALLAIFAQALLVALLLGIVFGPLSSVEKPIERAQRTVNLLFLLNVSCFWFGCNNAAKELVKERVIYARERDFNLRIDSYCASKYLVLLLLALMQSTLLFAIVRLWCGPAGSAFGQWLSLTMLTVAGTALGLLISACAKTEEMAIALVPIAVLPQIILAGVITPLSGLAYFFAKAVITVHWGEQALESLLPEETLAMLERGQPSLVLALAMAAIHIAAFTAAMLVSVRLRDRARVNR